MHRLKWTGSKLEFLQWAYGILRTDRVDMGKGELYKSVQALAGFFDLEIGKSTYVELSKSIHQYNDDYFPRIFEDQSESYLQYINIQKERRAG